MYKIIITMFISLFLFMGCYTNSNDNKNILQRP
jgi:hypothetical protein